MLKDYLYPVINIMLLAVLTFYSVLTVHTIEQQVKEHRLRNEAENVCQIQVVTLRPAPATTDEYLNLYRTCVDEKSGAKAPH